MINNFSRYEYERAGMVDDETGRLLGFVPDEFGIWAPPPSISVPEMFAPFLPRKLERVFLENAGIVGDPCLLFGVPQDWVVKGYKPGGWTRLKDFGWTKVHDTENLLEEFIALAEAKPEKYLRFAKKWGPLWEQVRIPFESLYKKMVPQSKEAAPWLESTEVWRMFAKEAKSCLDIAAYLHSGSLAPVSLWKSIAPNLEDEELNDITKQRRRLSFLLNLKVSNENQVWFSLDWSEEYPKLQLATKLGFINAVWFQLLQAVSKMQVCVCDGCGKVYVRKTRKPAKGRKNFCPQCSDKASKRLWAQENLKPQLPALQ